MALFGMRREVSGVRELQAIFAQLEPRHFRPAARKAVDESGKLVLREMRSRVRVKSGELKRDLGRKTKALKSGNGYVSIIGARRMTFRQYAREYSKFRAGKRKKAPRRREAWRRVHLEEFGRRAVTAKTKKVLSDGTVIYGKTVRAAPGSGFMKRTALATEQPVKELIKARMKEAAKAGLRPRR